MSLERMTKEEFTEMLDKEDLEQLQDRANLMNLEFKNNTRASTLKKLIIDAAYPEEETEAVEEVTPMETKPKKETFAEKRARVRAEATALKRVIVTCMNPAKSDWQGEYFTVSNKAIPTITRMVPFGLEWHVEQIILNQIEQRTFNQQTEKRVNGHVVNSYNVVPEFKIMELDQLTPQELKKLAADQAARGAIDSD